MTTITPSFASTFQDTNSSDVEYCYQNQLMHGVSNNKFEPNKPLTRGQFATVFRNLNESTPNGSLPFTDLAPTKYYY